MSSQGGLGTVGMSAYRQDRLSEGLKELKRSLVLVLLVVARLRQADDVVDQGRNVLILNAKRCIEEADTEHRQLELAFKEQVRPQPEHIEHALIERSDDAVGRVAILARSIVSVLQERAHLIDDIAHDADLLGDAIVEANGPALPVERVGHARR